MRFITVAFARVINRININLANAREITKFIRQKKHLGIRQKKHFNSS